MSEKPKLRLTSAGWYKFGRQLRLGPMTVMEEWFGPFESAAEAFEYIPVNPLLR